jgi:hypothetical protein
VLILAKFSKIVTLFPIIFQQLFSGSQPRFVPIRFSGFRQEFIPHWMRGRHDEKRGKPWGMNSE